MRTSALSSKQEPSNLPPKDPLKDYCGCISILETNPVQYKRVERKDCILLVHQEKRLTSFGLKKPRPEHLRPEHLKPQLKKQDTMSRHQPENNDYIDIDSEEERSEDQVVCCTQCAKELKQPLFCSKQCQIEYDEDAQKSEEGEKSYDDNADETDGDEEDSDGDSVMTPIRELDDDDEDWLRLFNEDKEDLGDDDDDE
jgi:hypothetical protein